MKIIDKIQEIISGDYCVINGDPYGVGSLYHKEARKVGMNTVGGFESWIIVSDSYIIDENEQFLYLGLELTESNIGWTIKLCYC